MHLHIHVTCGHVRVGADGIGTNTSASLRSVVINDHCGEIARHSHGHVCHGRGHKEVLRRVRHDIRDGI